MPPLVIRKLHNYVEFIPFYPLWFRLTWNRLPGVFLLDDHALQLGFWLLVSSIPVFLGGLGEDIGFDIKPTQRLLASLVSAALAGILFGYWVPYVDFPGLRFLTSMSLISVSITIIVSGGICHAVNLMDGLNGLSICWAICAASAMAIIALSLQDMAVFRLLLLLIGASIGILFWNFPLGKIFFLVTLEPIPWGMFWPGSRSSL